jgi:putative SOS response-associated peptidase YedK
MAELSWGLQPREGGRPFTVIRAEGRSFPTHRCLVPVSEFRMRGRGAARIVSRWLTAIGFTSPASGGLRHATGPQRMRSSRSSLTNPDFAPYHDRQMAVLRRAQRLDWLDATIADDELLLPLPAG